MNIRLRLILWIVPVLIGQCVPTPGVKFDQRQIIGQWELLDDQINYPAIQFNADSTAVFRSKSDTVYYFRYHVKGDSLLLKNIDGVEKVNRINVLDSSQLVFRNLLEYDRRQEYKRVNQ